MNERVYGIAASTGIAIAPVYKLEKQDLSFETRKVSDVQGEKQRLDLAIEKTAETIKAIKSRAEKNLDPEKAAVYDAHLLFLEDPEFVGQIKSLIEKRSLNAEAALTEVAQMFISIFLGMEDNAYMQERAGDIRDVYQRILATLLGQSLVDLQNITQDVIIVADDLSPSQTGQLNKEHVQAFVTNVGGRTSHSAIMARSLEIPAVVGTGNLSEKVKAGDLIIADAIEGVVILNPSEEELNTYREKRAAYLKQKEELKQLVHAESKTKDGHQVKLLSNIGSPKDIDKVLENGAEGIGLYRTEFLYMESDHLPSEEEQFKAYVEVLQALAPGEVVIRTMDIGGDKDLPYLDLPEELNPFLGYRAIRISLDRDDIFRTQLRALLRASAYGNLKIMFPMIGTLKEFREAKQIFSEERAKLEQAEVELADNIELGIMIEIPAAAVLADKFAREVDFFSVGTNDLIQYTMAADRINERVSYLYQPYNPSILRLLNFVIKSAHQEGKWVGMCGEMAGDPKAIPILLGLGLDEFSMSASSILATRSLLRSLDYNKCKAKAEEVLANAETTEDVLEAFKDLQEL